MAAIFIALIGIVDLITLASWGFHDGYQYRGVWYSVVGSSGEFLAAIIWIVLAIATYFIDYIILIIVISQKIMVVQRLTEISKKK